jgi:LmeA-like phospholipid-binding
VRYPHGPPHTDHTVWARPADRMRPPGQPGYGPPPGGPTPTGSNPSRISLRGPLSIVLIAVIVVSLVAGGLLAAELYARHTVNSRVAASAECVVGDKVTVSFGLKPLLLQHMTSDYGPISIITAGNQIRGAKGMTAEVVIDNVHLDGNDPSKGTIGMLDAAVTWPSSGVTRSVQDAIPLLSSFVSGARMHPSDGTIELRGALGSSIIVKPKVVNNAISLQVVGLTALGLTLPRAGVQSELDAFTNQLAKNLPLGIHADTVQVTHDGMAAHFSTHSASIGQGDSGQDGSGQGAPCIRRRVGR